MSANRRLSKAGESLYLILGLEKGCSQDDIKKAYRRMALQHHPDKNQNSPEATEKFQEINYANSVLSDPTKKEIYDEYGSMGLSLAEQIGAENLKSYFMINSKWCKGLMITAFILTGFCCCCCCCLCCCWCCGKCKPKEEEEEVPEEGEEQETVNMGYDAYPDTEPPHFDSFENEVQPPIYNISGSRVQDPPVVITLQPTSTAQPTAATPLGPPIHDGSPRADRGATAAIPLGYK